MNSGEYIEVVISIAPFSEENAEIVEAEIAELPYDSFMVEDGVLKAYVQRELYDARALKLVLSGLDLQCSFTASLIPLQNWNAQWESDFSPIVAGGRVTVRAPYHSGLARTRFNVVINPQMAFGTGHHQTTRMVMEAMLELEGHIRGGVVMDMGCGTGVLAILAAKMRAAKVYGIDIDAVAARSAYDNAHLNRLARRIEVYCGDASLLQSGKYDVLLANIHRNIIILDLRTYAMSLRSGGHIVLSGFYDSDVPDILAEASSLGLHLQSSRSTDSWSCLTLQK